jgi:hypothetical protein
MQAEVQKLELSPERLRALSLEKRFVFALAGHIFNELILLQKWIHVSRRPPGNPGPQEDAGVAISMFLLRLLSAKVYEALHDDALTKPSVIQVLQADYFGNVDGLQAKWDAAIARYKSLEWLGWVRNKCGFHYMNASQWTPSLGDEFCADASIYIGKRYADTYFHWAEMSASLPAMRHVKPDNPLAGLEQMLQELSELLGEITDCLARGLQSFIHTSGVGGQLSKPIRFDAPLPELSALHYFFADERLS